MPHFNQLHADEDEALAILAEEMGETLQAIGKVQRHGYESYNPETGDGRTNRDMLTYELGDVLAAIELLVAMGDVGRVALNSRREHKLRKLLKWTHHIHKSVIRRAIARVS